MSSEPRAGWSSVLVGLSLLVGSCAPAPKVESASPRGGDGAVAATEESPAEEPMERAPGGSTALATFGAGCFWCVEAVFEELDGVLSVESGYAGGHVDSPTYRQVCDGTTGHAEVAQIRYDPDKIRFGELLEVFWKTHDPTTLNRQGNDVGTQYRSAIFYHDEEQRRLAEEIKKELDASGAFSAPIVTQIVPFTKFWKAEDYHQAYYELNSEQPYCRAIIRPKLDKFRKVFADKLKQ